MPQRAKVSRVWRLSQGMSSVGPSRSVCAPSARSGGQQRLRIGRRHRPVRDPAGRGLDLDHRLEPVEPARAGADNVDRDIPPGSRCLDDRPPPRRRRPRAPRHRAECKAARSLLRLRKRAHPAGLGRAGRSAGRPAWPRGHRTEAEAIDRLQRHAAVGGGRAHLDAEPRSRHARRADRRRPPGRLRRGTA